MDLRPRNTSRLATELGHLSALAYVLTIANAILLKDDENSNSQPMSLGSGVLKASAPEQVASATKMNALNR